MNRQTNQQSSHRGLFTWLSRLSLTAFAIGSFLLLNTTSFAGIAFADPAPTPIPTEVPIPTPTEQLTEQSAVEPSPTPVDPTPTPNQSAVANTAAVIAPGTDILNAVGMVVQNLVADTVVDVLGRSTDQEWVYVETASAVGWVDADTLSGVAVMALAPAANPQGPITTAPPTTTPAPPLSPTPQ